MIAGPRGKASLITGWKNAQVDEVHHELLPGAAKDGGAQMSDVGCGPSPMENQPIPR